MKKVIVSLAIFATFSAHADPVALANSHADKTPDAVSCITLAIEQQYHLPAALKTQADEYGRCPLFDLDVTGSTCQTYHRTLTRRLEAKCTAQRVIEAQARAEQARLDTLPGPRMGMTLEEAKQTSWGQPQMVAVVYGRSGRRLEQYAFGMGRYLYFFEGRVVSTTMD